MPTRHPAVDAAAADAAVSDVSAPDTAATDPATDGYRSDRTTADTLRRVEAAFGRLSSSSNDLVRRTTRARARVDAGLARLEAHDRQQR